MPARRYPLRWCNGSRSDRGSSTVELVLLAPVLMFAVFVVVQFALWYHARSIVLAAAQEGARAARAEQGTAAAGQERAYSYVEQLGRNLVTDPVALVTRSPDTVVARVTAHAVNIVPGFTLTVSETSTGPVEHFRPPS